MSIKQLRDALRSVPSDQMVTLRAGDIKALLRAMEDMEVANGRLHAQIGDMNRMHRAGRKAKPGEAQP